jgi:hypothetical protein
VDAVDDDVHGRRVEAVLDRVRWQHSWQRQTQF